MNRLTSYKNVIHYSVTDLAPGRFGAISVPTQENQSDAANQSFYIQAVAIVVLAAVSASFLLIRLAAFFPA